MNGLLSPEKGHASCCQQNWLHVNMLIFGVYPFTVKKNDYLSFWNQSKYIWKFVNGFISVCVTPRLKNIVLWMVINVSFRIYVLYIIIFAYKIQQVRLKETGSSSYIYVSLGWAFFECSLFNMFHSVSSEQYLHKITTL